MSEEEQLDVLAQILTGELAEDSDEAQAFFESVPGARERWAEMQSVQALLTADAGDFGAAMAWQDDAPEAAPAPAPAAAPTKPRLRLLPFAGLVAAAAALVLLLQIIGPTDDPVTPGQGVMMGSGSIEVTDLTPVGPDQGTYAFAFATEHSGGHTAEVSVWSYDALSTAEPLLVPFFDGVKWNLTTDQEAALPGAIRWQLKVIDLEGNPLWVSDPQEASR